CAVKSVFVVCLVVEKNSDHFYTSASKNACNNMEIIIRNGLYVKQKSTRRNAFRSAFKKPSGAFRARLGKSAFPRKNVNGVPENPHFP
ncbi:MAG: hypothetical protein J6U38_05880, partial [Clostridia bacterium]|nr:hypothetical protein [Clostridia bacterium]